MRLLSDELSSDIIGPAELLEQATIALDKGDALEAAKLFNTTGNIYMSVTEFQEAAQNFERSLELYQGLKDESGIADSMYNLGVAQINLEQWDAAIKACEASMKLFEKANNKDGTADAMYGLALARLGLGNFEDAMNYFKKAQRVYKTVGNDQAVAVTLMDIGTAQADKEDLEAAAKTFAKALKLYKDLDDKTGIGTAHSLLGDIAELKNNQKKAAEHFVSAAQCYMESEIFDIAREVVERAEAKMWDVPKATRRRLRRVIDDIKDALPEETDEALDDDLLDVSDSD